MPHFLSARDGRPRASRALGHGLLALGAFVACNDPVLPEVQRVEVVSASVVAAALTGTARNSPAALLLRTTPASIDPESVPGADFAIALDINAAGRIVVYPAQLVVRLAPRRVGVRTVDQGYDALTRAPRGTYTADSAITVGVGQAFAVQLPGAGSECLNTGTPYFFSKVVVDSVQLGERLIFLRATTDPNCGFRSFAPGLPDD